MRVTGAHAALHAVAEAAGQPSVKQTSQEAVQFCHLGPDALSLLAVKEMLEQLSEGVVWEPQEFLDNAGLAAVPCMFCGLHVLQRPLKNDAADLKPVMRMQYGLL